MRPLVNSETAAAVPVISQTAAAVPVIRELLKKKMQIKSGLLPKRSYPTPPPPPQTFGTFGTLFRTLIFFLELFGHFLCRISPKSG